MVVVMTLIGLIVGLIHPYTFAKQMDLFDAVLTHGLAGDNKD